MDMFEDFAFDPPTADAKSHTLHIIKDDEVVHLTIPEIFDRETYDTLIGVTYSVTASFINRYLSDFNQLELVIGLPNERVKHHANMAAKQITAKIEKDLNGEPVELYQGLTTELKEKVAKKSVEVLVPLAHAIHSKFYLLSNTETNDNRLIIGSANLSEQAFNHTSNQFENIIIFDNHPLFQTYFTHYHTDLTPILTNYFSKELLNINAKKLKKHQAADDMQVEDLILLNNEDLARIKEQAILETFENTEAKIKLGILPVSVPEEMRNIMDDKQLEVRVEREQRKQKEISYHLTKEAISPRAKKPQLKSKSALKKVVRKRIKVKMMQDEDTGLPKRKIMVSSSEQRNLAKGNTGLYVPSDLNEEILHPIGQKATTEEIKTSLETLNRLIRSFEDFTVKYDETYGARVIEAILYTFTAPFIFEIKKHARSEEERNDIPQFLFLGGTAGSGKSSLLKAIARLTNQPKGLNYDSIIPVGGRRKKQTIDALEAWMSESNVSPLLIDEIPEDFFSNPNYGNGLIVNTANRAAYDLQTGPALIGTTNADGYTLEERARRRSYYLRLDKAFDEIHREQSQPIYNAIYEDLNSTLFNDFIVRIAERLDDDELNWANFGEAGKIDFLYHTREIFKEYYELVNIPLPIYFPLTRYDDSKETNQEKWRKLFLGTSQNDFKFDSLSGNVLFKMSLLDENISRFGKGKPSDIYKNALSPKVIVGSKDGTDIELDTPLFFEWIDVANPFISYYQDSLKAIYEQHPELFLEDKRQNQLTFNLENFIESKEAIDRYLHYIPKDLVIEKTGTQLSVSAAEFHQWVGLPPKKSIWNKMLSY